MARIPAIIALGLLALASLASAQSGYRDDPAFPGGAQGAIVRELIDVLNANDETRLRAFVETRFAPSFRDAMPIEDHLRVLGQFAAATGGVDFHSVRVYEPARPGLAVVVKDRAYGSWKGLGFTFTEAPEPLIEALTIAPARPPTDVQARALTEGEAVEELGAFLDRLCAEGRFSGTVLVAKGDQVLLTRACGEAERRFHSPVNLDTKFNLGSMNKMFTAVAIAQLAERGLVAFDDPISKFVDESWLPKSITDRVTVHHLLTHTSGLGSYFNDTFERSSRDLFREVGDYKLLVSGDTLAFEPGTNWQYSNTGMLLLGVVIESATGSNYFGYVRESVYAPAGMTDTDCYDVDCPVENLATGYYRADGCGGWRSNEFVHVIRGGPAGGGYSTVRDLHRFARALLTGKLVSGETLDRLWTDHSGAGYGYGFTVEQTPLGTFVGHGGGFLGINANLTIVLGTGYIAAIMANQDGAAAPIESKMRELLGGVRG